MKRRPDDLPKRKFSFKDGKKALSLMGKEHPSYIVFFCVAVIFSLGYVVLSIYAPSEVSDLTNLIAAKATQGLEIPLDEVARYGILLSCLYFVSALLSYFSSFILNSISNYYARDLRKALEEKINRLPLRYFDTHPFGDILSRITNDVDNIAENFASSIATLIQSLLMLVGVLVMMFVKSWQLALTCVASLPLLLLLIFAMGRLAFPEFRKRQKILGEINGIIEENYSGQMIIKAFGNEAMEKEQFDEPNKRLGKTMLLSELFMGMLQPAMNFVSYLAYAGVLLVGGLLLVRGEQGMNYGTLAEFLIYVNLFQSPLSSISQSMNAISSASAASMRVYEFLGEKELETEENKKSGLLPLETIKGEVEFDHVSFGYDESKEIIHDFSAKVKPGYKVAIVGPTGAGKTTMVNLFMRFYELKSGSISIDGVNAADLKRSDLRDIFGMVLQDTWVFEGSVRENLVYNTPGVTDEDIEKALQATHLSHYVKTLPGGLSYCIKDGSSLSSGEKQLLTITRAMIRNAPLLILDEATSNVDTRTEERIQKAMDALTKGRTSFVIAHRLSTIRNADLILVMKDGNIIEQGTHEELLSQKGFYYGLYTSQFAFA